MEGWSEPHAPCEGLPILIWRAGLPPWATKRAHKWALKELAEHRQHVSDNEDWGAKHKVYETTVLSERAQNRDKVVEPMYCGHKKPQFSEPARVWDKWLEHFVQRFKEGNKSWLDALLGKDLCRHGMDSAAAFQVAAIQCHYGDASISSSDPTDPNGQRALRLVHRDTAQLGRQLLLNVTLAGTRKLELWSGQPADGGTMRESVTLSTGDVYLMAPMEQSHRAVYGALDKQSEASVSICFSFPMTYARWQFVTGKKVSAADKSVSPGAFSTHVAASGLPRWPQPFLRVGDFVSCADPMQIGGMHHRLFARVAYIPPVKNCLHE